ncbi:MAG: hypothetical protein ACLTJQ_06920 [Dialister invisus]|jgi:hypothetical protein|uniref:hypothetical protein n=1 Tax=Dialister invisus TaxID=218538 RepID=UPI003995E06A
MDINKIVLAYNKNFDDRVKNDYIRFRLSASLKKAFMSLCDTQKIKSSLLIRALLAECLRKSNQKDISAIDISDSTIDDITYLARKLKIDKKDVIDNAIQLYIKEYLQQK